MLLSPLLLVRLLLITALAVPLFVFAQTPAPSSSKVIGTIESIDPTNGKAQVKTDAGPVWSVNLSDQTRIVRVPPGEKDLSKAVRIRPVDLSAGDRVLARGATGADPNTLTASALIVMTKADIAQKQAHDEAEWAQRGVGGIVTAVDPNANQITVNVRSAGGVKPLIIQVGPNTVVRRYAADSVKFADAKPSTLNEIVPGDQVRALGTRSEDGSQFAAQEVVSGSFRTIAATVISADPAANTVAVQDLANKQRITVHVNADTLMRRIPEQIATMLAMRLKGAGRAPGGEPGGAPGNGAAGAHPGESPPPAGGGSWRQGGGGAGPRAGHPDLRQMLERMPPVQLSELKKGDALIISSSSSSDPTNITAINLVAGVEPFLAAAPRTAGGQVNLGSWNLDMGGGMPGE